MGEPLSDGAFEKLLETEIPKLPPMSEEEIGRAYDELRAEGMLEEVTREDFIAKQVGRDMERIEAAAAEIEPVEVPPELRERILERARQVGSQGIRDISTYDIVDAEGPE